MSLVEVDFLRSSFEDWRDCLEEETNYLKLSSYASSLAPSFSSSSIKAVLALSLGFLA